MKRKSSNSKLTGEILMKHKDLINKLALLDSPAQEKQQVDELGFSKIPPHHSENDALSSLIKRGKNIVSTSSDLRSPPIKEKYNN